MNKEGYKDISEIIKKGTYGLNTDELENLANEVGALVLDVRSATEFAKGHIPQFIFIVIDGSFALWVGALIGDVKQPIVLVTPKGREEEAITCLSCVGFDHTLGYLKGGFETWKNLGKEYDTVNQISSANLKSVINNDISIFDVRKASEYLSERIPVAKNTPLDNLNNHLGVFPTEGNFYIHCAGGYRGMITASILKSRGVYNFTDIQRGFTAIKNANINTTDYVCPSTL